MRPPAEAVRHLAATIVGPDVAEAVAVGKVLDRDVLGVSGEGPWSVLGEDGSLLAVYEAHKGTTVKPSLVLAAR